MNLTSVFRIDWTKLKRKAGPRCGDSGDNEIENVQQHIEGQLNHTGSKIERVDYEWCQKS